MENGLKVRDRHTVVNFIDDYMRTCVALGGCERGKT